MALRNGMRVRPLLGLSKRDLLAHAQCMGWTWREDPSNQSNAYLRNRIRHEVLPLMEDLREPGTRAPERLGDACRGARAFGCAAA